MVISSYVGYINSILNWTCGSGSFLRDLTPQNQAPNVRLDPSLVHLRWQNYGSPGHFNPRSKDMGHDMGPPWWNLSGQPQLHIESPDDSHALHGASWERRNASRGPCWRMAAMVRFIPGIVSGWVHPIWRFPKMGLAPNHLRPSWYWNQWFWGSPILGTPHLEVEWSGVSRVILQLQLGWATGVGRTNRYTNVSFHPRRTPSIVDICLNTFNCRYHCRS